MKSVAVNRHPHVQANVNKRKGAAWKQIRKGRQLYLLLVLPVLYLIIFKYVPIYGAQIAFKDFIVTKGIGDSPWVGMKHFVRFFNNYNFWDIMKNTLGLSLYQLIAGFPFPILLALSLNYLKHAYFKKTVQMITYAPHFISVVVVVGLMMQFLALRTGGVNIFLKLLGFQEINFLGIPEYFHSLYVWSGIWQHVGFGCIVYLAALSGIDPSLHEAAVVDGASKLKRMWHIDLPGIMPIAVILLILNVGNLLDTGFEKVLLMQNPLNTNTSEVIDTYVYKIGLVSAGVNFSYASAIGLFKNVINLALLLVVNAAAKKLSESSLW
ncbi:ABC transporter permease [Paenibacillus piri]|uniref:Sugar ABC transporter permease n=1 Tax=Paenibacillus piri TaxID=2547395 RepID=A0A4R5KP57_9BACL|nr:ABC transporter permease subunit [Paenibacillus piri]TDF97483.1 sugar ABC transporter permease [Paenibacillus piri]